MSNQLLFSDGEALNHLDNEDDLALAIDFAESDPSGWACRLEVRLWPVFYLSVTKCNLIIRSLDSIHCVYIANKKQSKQKNAAITADDKRNARLSGTVHEQEEEDEFEDAEMEDDEVDEYLSASIDDKSDYETGDDNDEKESEDNETDEDDYATGDDSNEKEESSEGEYEEIWRCEGFAMILILYHKQCEFFYVDE